MRVSVRLKRKVYCCIRKIFSKDVFDNDCIADTTLEKFEDRSEGMMII